MTVATVATPSKPPVGIVVEGLRKAHKGPRRGEERVIFDRFDLTVEPDQIVAILGRNGSGKSTLLRVLAGLDTEIEAVRIEPRPQSHDRRRIWHRSAEATEPSSENGGARTQFTLVPASIAGWDPGIRMTKRSRAWVSVASQDYKSVLLPWYTVRDNLRVAAQLSQPKLPPAVVDSIVEHQIARFMIADAWADALPKTLSGGQAQRAVLARAFVVDPTCVLLDEPFAALDFDVHIRLRAIVWEEIKARQAPTLAVVHSIEDAVFLGDRVLVLSPDHPTRILREFEIDLPSPRAPQLLDTPQFIELEREIRDYVLTAFPAE